MTDKQEAIEVNMMKWDQLRERMEMLIVEAKAKGLMIEISDGRFFVCGIPSNVTNSYIEFSAGWEIVKTGDISGAAQEVEEMVGTHIVTWQGVPSFRLCRKPKK